jgi:hypothetical protein
MQDPFIGMPKAIFAQLAPHIPLFIGLLAFVVALQVLEAKFGRRRGKGRRWSRDDGRSWPGRDGQANAPLDAADQLRIVMQSNFKARPLLNKSEARLFRAIDKMVTELAPPGWLMMAQVSLGEILQTGDKAAYSCINSKRVDLLLVDGDCNPVHAIEYHGGGHFKGAHATAARDAVKKEALRRAGIGYVEVVPGDAPAELRRVVERLVGRDARS